MLILSTYRVVLHPSYLQKVFSFIIFIKERYSLRFSSEKSRAPGGAPWAELKSDEHLSADRQQNRDIWCHFTYHLQFWIMTGIFYSWDCSIFQYQRCANQRRTVVYKTFVNKHTWETPCCPEKQTGSTVHVTLGSSGSWTRLSFPYNEKYTSLDTFFPSESRAVQLNEARWWACTCTRAGRCVQGRILPGEMSI